MLWSVQQDLRLHSLPPSLFFKKKTRKVIFVLFSPSCLFVVKNTKINLLSPNFVYSKMLEWSTRAAGEAPDGFCVTVISNVSQLTDKPICKILASLSMVYMTPVPSLVHGSHHGWPCPHSCSPGRLSPQEQEQRLLAWRAPLAWWVCMEGLSAGGSDCRGFRYLELVSDPEDLQVR